MINWNDIIRFVNHGNPTPPQRVEKSIEEWKDFLDKDIFQITREKGTERAHSSSMCQSFESGTYNCACCGVLLFDSSDKFDSQSGWPSFTQPAVLANVAYHKDRSYNMIRVEVTCNICEAHLGHVFPDGPVPSGLRYCINAFALKKISNFK